MSQSLVPAYELLASDIHALGIECVFGLMSDDTAQFITTLDAMGVRFYEMLGFKGGVGVRISLPGGLVLEPVFMDVNERQHTLAFAPAPPGKRIHHLMFQYSDLRDLGLAHDLVRSRQVPVAMQLGMHANDQQLSFYSGNPSGWSWELGWGGRAVPAQMEYHTRDTFGHAPEATGFALDLPMNG